MTDGPLFEKLKLASERPCTPEEIIRLIDSAGYVIVPAQLKDSSAFEEVIRMAVSDTLYFSQCNLLSACYVAVTTRLRTQLMKQLEKRR